MGAIAFAGTLGTIIEWYDFLIYGTAAALVFNKLFFPTVTPLAGTLAALATYAVGFVARPVGGALFGYFGDRIGRKSMLMLTMFVMGLGTFLIGLLPTYGQIGLWAPALLVVLRFIQGIGLGGEWGGASLMVLEHAPSDRRGFYGSLVQVGFPLGLVTSSGVFAIVTLLPEDQFLAWGWRIPFLISIVLVALGAFIRARIPETPVFWAAVIEVATIPLFGYLTDKIGRRPFYFAGVIFTIAFAFPLFWLLDMKTPWIVMTAVIVALNFGHGLMFAPESAYFPELFGARVRYSGASFGFQASAAIGGGFAPIIATALAAYMGGTAGVSVMLVLLALLTLVATFFAHETKDQPLLK
jgi:MHS family shikimate/dehydroshikimate transporter-like MFS transporter